MFPCVFHFKPLNDISTKPKEEGFTMNTMLLKRGNFWRIFLALFIALALELCAGAPPWAVFADEDHIIQGNVGIGTASPSGKRLKVQGDADITGTLTAGSFSITNLGTVSVTGTMTFSGVTTDITTAGSEHLALMPGGNVGIGTTGPATKLHALLDTNNVDIIRASTAAHSIGLGIDSAATYWGASLFQDGTKRFTVESNGGILVGGGYQGSNAPANGAIIEGNVGIGTTGPGAKLDVKGEIVARSTVNDVILTKSSWAGNSGGYFDIYKDGVVMVHLSAWTGAGHSYFNEGNVGIGTTSPVAKLDVAGWIKSKTGYVDQNMLDTTYWTISAGSIGSFSANQSTAENDRIWNTDPFGRPTMLWRAVNDAGSDADGGWNYNNIPIDNNKAYRLTVWVKKDNTSSGTVYLGCDGGNTNDLNNANNTNPYFFAFASNNLIVNRWYL